MTDDSDTKIIPLTQGKVTIVDSDDYDYVSQYKWLCNAGYARRFQCGGVVDGKRKRHVIGMHQFIMNACEGMEVDHRDGNKLNNTKANLRVCTHGDNTKNKKPRQGCTSKFKGVCRTKYGNTWEAYIHPHGKKIGLGTYRSETEAALAYNQAAMKYFGDFARINVIDCA